MRNWDEITPLLDAKLDRTHIKPPSKYGPKGEYIEGWFAIAEANRIFGFDGWSYEIVKLDAVSEAPREIGKDKLPGFGVTYTARIRATVGSVSREDVGAGHGYGVDLGLAHESAIKEAVTDALKRALRTFGNPFGLALYDKSGDGIEEPARPAYKKPEPTHASGQPSLSQQAAPAGPRDEPMLTKAMGEALIMGIANCHNRATLISFRDALAAGPNAFAANHPKIKVAISERYKELEAIPFGELPVPGTEALA